MLAFLVFFSALVASAEADPFSAYWYQGKAEITSYRLKQARYGEIRDGHAVLIFVTEDFSRSRQVKLDDWQNAGNDGVKVLKLNLTKKFTTGIYPYSMMASVFTPVDLVSNPRTLKISATSQEWCGHTFTQFNLEDESDRYRVRLFSYFEREGDRDVTLEAVIPEDELWNRIRLAPESLPTGDVRLIPGTLYQRLSHSAWGVRNAQATLSDDPSDRSLRRYSVLYPDLNRTLLVRFKKPFPHEIESWEETYRDGRGADAAELTTRATRIKRIRLDYWNKNSLGDEPLRTELGLE